MQERVARRAAIGERRFGRVNWLGLWTLIDREVRRFVKIWLQTILAPVVTALLFLTVFTFAFAERRPETSGTPFIVFLAPGVVMMAVIQNAFANTSSSILHAKILGNIHDTIVAPLSPGELNVGYAIGGIARGLAVAAAALLVVLPVAGTGIAHPIWVLYFAVAGACLLASLGTVAGMWADKFDHMATITNFVITPLSFLSGTFYSVTALPKPWSDISLWNPFFYLIDGFRYGVIGTSDADPFLGLAVTLIAVGLLWALSWYLFRIGYKIKD